MTKYHIYNEFNQLGSLVEEIDLYELFIMDLFEFRHPCFYKKSSEREYSLFKEEYLSSSKPVWVYYPWLNKAFKIPGEQDFFEVLTSRNKPYVSYEEQKRFYEYNVGIVGLSVGQSTALTIVRGGGSRNIKIADADKISPSNLNRLQLGINSIGKKKTEEVYKRLLEINPFLNILPFHQGLTEDNIDDFFNEGFKLDVVVDACDDFKIKMKLRERASKYNIPVIMATDVGDGSLIDIERYDLDDPIEPFGGRHKSVKSTDDFLKAAVTIISPEYFPLTLIDRFFEIGKTAPTHPQLANSVFFSATLISYIVRCMANNRDIISERVFVDYADLFDPDHKKENFTKVREQKIKAFKKLLGME